MSQNDVLSREEIDTLLSESDGVASGTAGARADGEPLDLFKRGGGAVVSLPDLSPLPEKFCRALVRWLDGLIGNATVSLEADPVLMEYGEFVKARGVPCGYLLAGLPPACERLLLAVDATAAGSGVSLVFGGDGAVERDPERELTATEQRIARRILDAALQSLSGCIGADPSLEAPDPRFETSPDSVGLCGEHDVVGVLAFRLGVGAGGGLLYMVMPALALQKIARKPDAPPTDRLEAELWPERLLQSASLAPVHVRARVAEFELRIGDLLRLEAGDFIPVEVNRKVVVHAGGQDLFQGVLGVSGAQQAIHITERAGAPEQPAQRRLQQGRPEA